MGRRNTTSIHGVDIEFQRPTMDSFEEFGGDEVDYNPLFATNQRFASRGEAFGYGSSNVDYDSEKPKRKSKNVKCRCKFRIRAVENYHFQDNKRLVLWNIVTANGFGCHNHQPTKYKDGHRHYAGLNEEEKAYVRQQYRASVLPRDIKSDLHKKTPDKPQPSSSQIYSETSKIRREMRRERNTAQKMLALAVEANYVHWHEINPETHELTHVFMSHSEAMKLFRAYPHVVLIDSTYKTNTYNMALVLKSKGFVECEGVALEAKGEAKYDLLRHYGLVEERDLKEELMKELHKGGVLEEKLLDFVADVDKRTRDHALQTNAMMSQITALTGLVASLTKTLEVVGNKIGADLTALTRMIEGGMPLIKPPTSSTVPESSTTIPQSTPTVDANIQPSKTETTNAANDPHPSSSVQTANVPKDQLPSSSPPKTEDSPRRPAAILDLPRLTN
ncbi:hypothetical protein RND81_09G064600 [Saponaria officinalis]|uniref:ZSWIM1/3 RNaseH-like domain-containing protein n=1 Tax=Saponaria officinalis TaxID=3572 RepID=A0AAW1IJJ5_SAPOF